MLHLLDIFLTLTHIIIICFNLLGWIIPATRKAHLVCIIITAASWFILGIWFGVGYCPITDWQWQVKQKLGERNLPNSFIEYYADRIPGMNFSSALIDLVTGIAFGIAAAVSVYVNFFLKPKTN